MTMNMSQLRDKTVKWYMALLFLFLVVILFATLLSSNARKLEQLRGEEASLRLRLSQTAESERTLRLQLSGSSSGSAMADQARAMSFVLPDEVCFEILDADLLDKYTEKEWAILMEERNLGLR